MTDLQIHYNDKLSALYVDGKLDPLSIGDHSTAGTRALKLTGVVFVCNSKFLRGGDVSTIAGTLVEIDEYQQRMAEWERKIQKKLDELEALRREAPELNGGGSL